MKPEEQAPKARKPRQEPSKATEGDSKTAEDPLEALIEEAMALKEQLREVSTGLTGLVKGVGQARKDRAEKDRDHLALKRSLRSLQRPGV